VAGVLLVRFATAWARACAEVARTLSWGLTTPETRGRAYGFHHALESLGAVIGTMVGYLLLAGGCLSGRSSRGRRFPGS